MMIKLPQNLEALKDYAISANYLSMLQTCGMKLHFTNGTFAYDANMIVPTVIAGYQFLVDQEIAAENDTFIIAVNSHESMKAIMTAKGTPQREIDALEPYETRALKVALPLALQFPKATVCTLSFDEETPAEMYEELGAAVTLNTLQKWGYGTTPDAPKIVGAEHFENVYAFPLPNDTKPVAFDLTPAEDQSALVTVAKLTEMTGKHGAPFISREGRILFPVSNPALEIYKPASQISYVNQGTVPAARP